MKTLKQLLENYAKAPAMSSAITSAIATHGENAEALIIGGTPSTRKGSNIARSIPEGYKIAGIYPGAKRQYKSQGYNNIVVLMMLE